MRRIDMKNRTKSVVHGILLIALAASLILWKLNIFNLPAAFAEISVFGIVIAVIMVVAIIQNIIDLSWGGIFVPLAILAIIFEKPLGIEAITPWIVLIAAILLTIAFEMIFPKNKFHRHLHGHHINRHMNYDDKFSETSNEDENGYVMHSMKFGSCTKYVRSQNLTKADLSSQFGEMDVFFDQAQVPSGNVEINVSVQFGEMDLYIPKTWKVVNKTSVMLGDCDDACSQGYEITEDQVVCTIQGSVSFGELQLKRI